MSPPTKTKIVFAASSQEKEGKDSGGARGSFISYGPLTVVMVGHLSHQNRPTSLSQKYDEPSMLRNQ